MLNSPLLPVLATCLLYLTAGAFREAVVVSYYRAIAKNKRFSASGLAGGIELYDLVVLYAILKSGWSPILLGSYVIGVVVGTYLGMCKK